MKKILAVLVFAGLILSLHIVNTFAAPGKSKGPGSATDNQSKEITITGVVTMSNDGKSYIIKETKNPNWINKIWFLPAASKYKYNEFELLEVEATCTRRGDSIVAIRSLKPLFKEQYEAKLAELKAKAAEEKKAAAQKKK
ncbi:MAG: hypothetical protein A2283_20460 [Lentisphaerae bacterium RIFOXYA12_FULL_48_11]|nr:MAG: hypothetical protein A2283_20460 [Lentisphaerae bacterium RIFOXYA12_FULL_48_11]